MEFILLFVAFLGVGLFFYKILHFSRNAPNIVDDGNLFIYGHRGVPSLMPENTIASFQKAIELDVDGIELDIQITKDKILVVHHDPHLERLTGNHTQISSLYYDDINSIDARGNKFTGVDFQYIPTLEEALTILPDDKIVNIEIKSQQLFSEGMEAPTVALIEKLNIVERVVVSSFNPLVIRKIKKLNKKIAVAQLWDKEEPYSSYYWIYISRPTFLHLNIDQIDVSILDKINKIGLPIFAYTVNSMAQYEKAKKLKLNGIFTDNPQLFNDK